MKTVTHVCILGWGQWVCLVGMRIRKRPRPLVQRRPASLERRGRGSICSWCGGGGDSEEPIQDASPLLRSNSNSDLEDEKVSTTATQAASEGDQICTCKNGNGWKCSSKVKPGYLLCEHHLAQSCMRKLKRRLSRMRKEPPSKRRRVNKCSLAATDDMQNNVYFT